MSNITTDQVAELLAQGKSGRVTRELLQAFLQNPHGHVHGKPADYPVTIDYGLKLSEMIDAGRYDWKNADINEKSFPVKGNGTVETKLELVHLNEVASTSEVEAKLERQGLRAATIEELLGFGAKYPEIQREFPVIALGSLWVNDDGVRHVPYLDIGESKRGLYLRWRGHVWPVHGRFLAVRK